METRQRMIFVDNLRLGAIVLVVCLHVAVTYSGLGSWYYKEELAVTLGERLFFMVFQGFLQAFFMGTLFMVAGYFAAASLASKGRAAFLKGRLFRLGAPTLFYMLFINPLLVYFLTGVGVKRPVSGFFDYYGHYIVSGKVLSGTGPMWFALALLIFCIVYALLNSPPRQPLPRPFPARFPALLALAASLGAFVLRLQWPMGTSIFNMQLCYFSQYIILFCFGVSARDRNWLQGIGSMESRRYFIAALLGIPVMVAFIFASGLQQDVRVIAGGFNWPSAGFALWESFTGIFMSVGLVGCFAMAGTTGGLSSNGFRTMPSPFTCSTRRWWWASAGFCAAWNWPLSRSSCWHALWFFRLVLSWRGLSGPRLACGSLSGVEGERGLGQHRLCKA